MDRVLEREIKALNKTLAALLQQQVLTNQLLAELIVEREAMDEDQPMVDLTGRRINNR